MEKAAPTDNSLSIIVPAYNEENDLGETVETVLKAIKDKFPDYEIIIFDDCSTDRTGVIADELARDNPAIRVVHNEKNMGFGYNYVKGRLLARKEFVVMVPGDNQTPEDSISHLLDFIGSTDADIIIPYIANYEVRPLSRQLISKAFTLLLNVMFGLNLKYYNGPVIHKSSTIKSIDIKTFGFAYQAEALIKLIRSGRSYIEIPLHIIERVSGKTKAFKPKNVIRVTETILRMFWEIRIAGRKKYNAPVKCLGVVEP